MQFAGTYLYGHRMYETMAVWETEPAWRPTSRESMRTYCKVRTRSCTPRPSERRSPLALDANQRGTPRLSTCHPTSRPTASNHYFSAHLEAEFSKDALG